MKLHISPCPNDTFVFHAMTHGLVDCEGINYELCFDDIARLNLAAQHSPEQEDVIKISYGALEGIAPHFRIADSGSALGYGNGPLLVSRRQIDPSELRDAMIAIPGSDTTAARLLDVLYPSATRRRVYLFSEIAEAVADGEVDAGVLIHEGRFVFERLGLRLIADLGQGWEQLTRLPIPLGGIAVSRRLSDMDSARVSRTIARSVAYAMENPRASAEFVRSHARELDADVLQKHISYFVNDFTCSLGVDGREAIARLVGADVFSQVEFV